MSLEILHCAFVLFSRVTRVERAEVPALACLWILLARVESILPRFQFSDHLLMSSRKVPRELYSLNSLSSFFFS